MIAFIGAVFSPAYYRARRRSLHVDPLAHCALNVVVHGPGVNAWALSEYRGALVRERDALVLGRNRIERDADAVTLDIDERSAPWGGAIRGRVRLFPRQWLAREHDLDRLGRHRWWPIAPAAHIEVELEKPALRFSGRGYHDANTGAEPLERGFDGWSWSRGSCDEGVALLYDTVDREGERRELGLWCDRDGHVSHLDTHAVCDLGPTRWRLPRPTRTDTNARVQLRRTLVDAPFYARSWFDTQLAGHRLDALHEIVDLRRFERPSTQLMLPFRTRGVGWL